MLLWALIKEKLKSSYGNRIIAADWNMRREMLFTARIYFKGTDKIGLLNDVTQVISQQLNVNIHKLSIETNEGIFEGTVEIYIHDLSDVKSLCKRIGEVNGVVHVARIN